MVEVNGRGWRDGYVSVTHFAELVVIHVDDAADPEKWLELRVPAWELCIWYARVREARRATSAEGDPPPSAESSAESP